ncbi:MAG: TRAP-type C4-dicarboxylate transport system permease small subunit [Bradymonadia bacterium]|jgi:TRAP-type C4-dicarboxylate transport system permease small subunit
MANLPISSGATPARGPAWLRAFVAADDAVYAVERVLVTGAMLVMSAVVCLNILFQFLVAERAAWRMVADGSANVAALWPMAIVLMCTIALTHSCTTRTDLGRNSTPVATALTALIVFKLIVLSGLMLWLPSSVICGVFVFAIGSWMLLIELDRPRPIGTPDWNAGRLAALSTIAITTVFGVTLCLQAIPAGYTWSQKLALFLLLWVAFIGASMATHDQQHLKIDAVRKAVPAKHRAKYNALSELIAAGFTIAMLVLSVLYLQDRLAEQHAPGEIPDWLKVLSIPVALSLVSIRFLGRAATNLIAPLPPSEDPPPGLATALLGDEASR